MKSLIAVCKGFAIEADGGGRVGGGRVGGQVGGEAGGWVGEGEVRLSNSMSVFAVGWLGMFSQPLNF